MKKYWKAIALACAALSWGQSWAEIVEVQSIKEVQPFVHEDTWVVFDLDNTLITHSQMLGSNTWYHHLWDSLIEAGIDQHPSMLYGIYIWQFVQMDAPVECCEPETKAIVCNLQESGIPVLGLTARGFRISGITLEKLEDLGLDMTATSPSVPRGTFAAHKTARESGGVVFANGQNKGDILTAILLQQDKMPSRVIMVDDGLGNVQDVEPAMERLGIDYVGCYYRGMADRVAAFDGEIAKKQFYHYWKDGEVISDEEARARLVSG